MYKPISIEIKKRILYMAFLTILLAASMCFLSPLFRAAEDERVSLEKSIEDMPNQVIMQCEASDFYTIIGMNKEATINKINEFATKISKTLSGVGVVVMIGLVLYSILKEISNGDITLDMWLRICIKFAIGIALVIWTDEICAGIQAAGEEITGLIAEGVNGIEGMHMGALDASNAGPLVGMLGCFISLYIRIVGYTLVIEMAIRRAFFPIATVSIVTRGMRSPAIRYLKKYLVIYVKLGLMVFVLKLGQVLLKSMGGGEQLLAVFCVLAACISFVGKGSTIADQIMGTD